MAENLFAQQSKVTQQSEEDNEQPARQLKVPNYQKSICTIFDHTINFLLGFAGGFAVLYIFYRLFILSMVGGLVMGIINVFLGQQRAVQKRLRNLRVQFFDMLEAMSVSMRAGNPIIKALHSARSDLVLIHSENSDIVMELDIMLLRFDHNVRLSESLLDFANRCGLEDVASFASVYATIEGKSNRADDIVKETQQIISDKMSIEMEIETLMTASKSEVNIMLCMPLVILLVMSYAGAGFLDGIYHGRMGRLVATGGLVIFIISYIMARKFSSIEV